MLQKKIEYKIQTADYEKLFSHLVKCDNNFVPHLSEKTDIAAYSNKIVENSITFEAWINAELAGLIAAYFNNKNTLSGFITNVSTVKEYSGMGIASKLMEMCITYASENGFKEITLEVANENKNAIQLYQKYLFTVVGSRDDLLIMKRDL